MISIKIYCISELVYYEKQFFHIALSSSKRQNFYHRHRRDYHFCGRGNVNEHRRRSYFRYYCRRNAKQERIGSHERI